MFLIGIFPSIDAKIVCTNASTAIPERTFHTALVTVISPAKVSSFKWDW